MVWRASGVLVVLLVLAAVGSYAFAPRGDAERHGFDTLIVLGAPANGDGTPSVEDRARVLGAVAEYKAGRAPRMILTGGAAHNRYVEAEAMAQVARAAGVPEPAIVVEGRARNTVENIWYSRQIMQAHGWTSAEVVSDPAHVHRAGLILSHYDAGPYALRWATHAAGWPAEYSGVTIAEHVVYEVLAVNRVRWGGFPAHERPFLPGG